jgi:hypothetical protein
MTDIKESSSTWPDNALPKAAMDWLFNEMAMSWGNKFSQKWAGLKLEDMKLHWAKRLAGITEMEYRRGVAKMRRMGWPPDLPEFLNLCRPDVNPQIAFQEALEGVMAREMGEIGTWSHPAIYWASVRVSAHDMKNLTYPQIKARWEAALAEELEKGVWAPIAKPPLRLGAPGKLSNETAKKTIQELKAGGIFNKKRSDDKGWARAILERAAAGDKTLSSIQIHFAKEALERSIESE